MASALTKRGATVTHHGTNASHAPSIADADITVEWTVASKRHRLLVEVAKRSDESEFTSIVEHLNRAIAVAPGMTTNVLYSGLSTSVRMARFLRNENQQRERDGRAGRIVFLPLNRLQTHLSHWAAAPAKAYPLTGLTSAVARWPEFATDLAAAQVFQEEVFPDWTEEEQELDLARLRELAVRQERLRRDIVGLENKLRERGVTGQRAHKFLIYLFFVALYEDKRGIESRATLSGFADYRTKMSPADRADKEFKDWTVHHLIKKDIVFDPDIVTSGMFDRYERLELPDEFIVSTVLPIFERYPLSAGGIDFIGAVFEALARRAEKDNRIGQFFTPETAVISTVRLVSPRPSDVVLDPACGTGRFLIHAMDAMLANAVATATETKEEVEQKVRRERLLGTDIDPWVATIAKMNMYLHGDGKSNVRPANGLALSAYDVFAPRTPARAHEAIDVALTNPPLGDVNFREVAAELARSGSLGKVKAAPGSEAYESEIAAKANRWTKERLRVVPHTCVEQTRADTLSKRVTDWRDKLLLAMKTRDERKERHARRHLDAAEAGLAEVKGAIAAGKLTYVTAGNNAKGGALFLSAILDYLKPIRDAGAPEEWKGGIVGIVVDEAVLNTSAYGDARSFIRDNYFIKAVVSLPRNAFEFLARTTAKTSILLLIKKPDPAIVQREPVFFAKAHTIGYTSTGVDDRNDFPAINEAFNIWRQAAPSSYAGGVVSPARLAKATAKVPLCDGLVSLYQLSDESPTERLDFAYNRMKELVATMGERILLSSVIEPVTRIPNTELVDEEALVHSYAWVRSTDGRVRPKGIQDLQYDTKDLREIKSGDILVSGIDAVRGAIGVVEDDCDGLIVSKEFFTFRVRESSEGKVDAQYVARLLRSEKMRAILEGAITGVSNRTRLESPAQLIALPIPPLPSIKVQQSLAEQVRAAFRAQDEAAKVFAAIDKSLSA
ncbi:N-6 DNA methylase [Sphingomonas mucosissima]|nr:N-6 DNA methylase [Sphingomonas mucosissima]